MLRASLKFQVIGVIVMMILALFAVVGLIMRPTIHHIMDLRNNINATERILEEQYQRTKHQRRSMRELGDLTDQVDRLRAAAMTPGTELVLITALEEVATKNNVKQHLDVAFTNVAPNQDRPHQPSSRAFRLPYYTVSVTVGGDFRALMAYLKGIEDLPQYVVIDNLLWEKKRETPDAAATVTLHFDGRVYASQL